MNQCDLNLRWANGNRDGLAQSSAYPGAFGRAFAFAHMLALKKVSLDEMHQMIRPFADQCVQNLPPPGKLAPEEIYMGLKR